MSRDEDPSTAAEIRALAEQAEAEAAEAEALAAAARARARALALRRQADRAAAAEKDVAAEKVGPTEDLDATQQAATPVAAAESGLEADATETEQGETVADEAADADARDADDAAEVTPEPSSQARRLTRLRRRPNWSTVFTSLAILVVAAAVAGSVYMIKHHEDAVRRRHLVAEFAAAARQGVITLTSLNFQNAKNDIQRIVDNSTGSFRDDLVKTADDFGKVVQESKVVEQGTVQLAAVDLDSLTNDSAVVYVASTSEVTNSAGAKQDPRNYRLIVTMTRDGGQLKMSKVEFVP
ncbi:hypothetical protein [Mycobacterium sp. 1423905.2]|uniref:hypothetical protein n=1 Tax=Mycobacterium sp. 1423905.2 TaxID=1856859 RepID=UPI0007FB80D1|nr:hypothetical protein [Mycobacterium sp. 1423905.2]OBJ48582.1 hypothetical protein A9W95_03940 [Mycobacterium sp. 1423905.2]